MRHAFHDELLGDRAIGAYRGTVSAWVRNPAEKVSHQFRRLIGLSGDFEIFNGVVQLAVERWQVFLGYRPGLKESDLHVAVSFLLIVVTVPRYNLSIFRAGGELALQARCQPV